jgi:arginyl-tRNA--protein-N-Asp/Glu arginylyltransferase
MDNNNKRTKKLVYKIQCTNCEKCYIGETNREKSIRLKEHQKDIKKSSDKSNIAKHANDHKHAFNFPESETLSLETNWKRRIIKESLFTEETYGKAINDVKFKLKVFS